MEHYRKQGKLRSFEDSEPTEKFIRRFNDLSDSMNSRKPAGAYRKGSKHETVSAVNKIIALENMKRIIKNNVAFCLLSQNTIEHKGIH